MKKTMNSSKCDLSGYRERKLSALKRKLKNKSGIIILVVLWTLVILAALAVSLGRNTNIELTLTKHSLGKARSKYFAFAGIQFALNQIRMDSKDKESAKEDTLYYCARLKNKDASHESLFAKKKMGDGYFDIQYDRIGDNSEGEKKYYGLEDEERKININALNANSAGVLSELIVLLGFDDETGKTVAYSVIDWVDSDKKISISSYGAEDDYYMGLDQAFHCKNLPFDSMEELLLVRGMTLEVFEAIKNYITIFPERGKLKVNFDTASKVVLQSLTRSFAGGSSNTEISDADSAVDKIIDYRKGEDSIEFSEDDRVIDINKAGLNAKEKAIALSINKYRIKKSNYLRVNVAGVEENRNIKTKIVAVIKRSDLSFVYWKRE